MENPTPRRDFVLSCQPTDTTSTCPHGKLKNKIKVRKEKYKGYSFRDDEYCGLCLYFLNHVGLTMSLECDLQSGVRTHRDLHIEPDFFSEIV